MRSQNFTKEKKINEKPKIDVKCPQCKQRKWTDFDEGSFCEICGLNPNK